MKDACLNFLSKRLALILIYFFSRYDVVEIAQEIPSRGLDAFSQGTKCLRLGPDTDATNGFFIACFQRKEAISHRVNSKSCARQPNSEENLIFDASQYINVRSRESTNNIPSTQEVVRSEKGDLKNVKEHSMLSSKQIQNKKRKRSKTGVQLSAVTDDHEKSSKKAKPANVQAHSKTKSCQDANIKCKSMECSSTFTKPQSAHVTKQNKKKQKKKKRTHKPVTSLWIFFLASVFHFLDYTFCSYYAKIKSLYKIISFLLLLYFFFWCSSSFVSHVVYVHDGAFPITWYPLVSYLFSSLTFFFFLQKTHLFLQFSNKSFDIT